MGKKEDNPPKFVKSLNQQIIVDKFSKCKFVKSKYEPNGHDCWGNTESYETNYVWIGEKTERVFEDMFIIHNGEEVLATAYDWNLEDVIFRVKQELGNRLQLRLFKDE